MKTNNQGFVLNIGENKYQGFFLNIGGTFEKVSFNWTLFKMFKCWWNNDK